MINASTITLHDIKINIDNYKTGNRVVLNDTIAEGLSAFFQNIFQVKEIDVNNLMYTLTECKLCVSGTTPNIVDSTSSDSSLDIIFSEDISNEESALIFVDFTIRYLPSWTMPLDSNTHFGLTNVVKSFKQFLIDKPMGVINGSLVLAKTNFDAVGAYDPKRQCWSIKLCLAEGERFSVNEILELLCGYMGTKIDMSKFPIEISIVELVFIYTTKSQTQPDEMFIKVITSNELEIIPSLKIGKFGIEIHKWDMYYELKLHGNITIGTNEMPVLMCRIGDTFAFGTSPGISLPSIGSVTKFIGLETKWFLPDGFIAESLILNDFIVFFPSTFNAVKSFNLSISTAGTWAFSIFDFIILRNISFGFSSNLNNTTNIAINGTIDIKTKKRIYPIDMGAIKTDGWIFSGFLNIRDNPITLREIIESFGVSSIPTFVDDIDFGLNYLMLSYDISAKIFRVELGSDNFGDISLEITNDKTLGYDLVVSFKEDIHLSDIPIVGTALHVLDAVALSKLQFIISSFGRTSQGISPGVGLIGSIFGRDFALQLFKLTQNNTNNENDGIAWITIEKSLGVFVFHRLGVGLKDSRVLFLIDGSLAVSPLTLSLMGAEVSVLPNDPSDIKFSLSGLGVDYRNNALTISGAFNKTESNYQGVLSIQISTLSILAAGTYSNDALFLYALLKTAIGGPPVFFVNGLSVGFGCNQALEIGSIEKVADFPLVKAAMGRMTAAQMLIELGKYMYAEKGYNFLAVGVQFTSFKLLNSFCLATVEFGKKLNVTVVGISEMGFPSNVTKPLAYAQLALKASFSPEDNLITVAGQLTSESYILSHDCHLTGGFAFYLWTGGQNKGDFVVSIGGYSSNYTKPDFYPNVPRVGFNWKINSNLTLSGEMYAAITPSMLMAGGRINAIFESGAFKAWFVAKADFEIGWKPFYYDALISISVGASYRINMLGIKKTFAVELGASLHIWGPEFQGEAHIKWYIISVTVRFGKKSTINKDVTWNEFKSSFIPDAQNSNSQSPCTIRISNGLIKQTESTSVVGSDTLEIIASSALPATKVALAGIPDFVYEAKEKHGLLPMGKDCELDTVMNIALKNSSGITILCDYDLVYENLPGALYSKTEPAVHLVSDAVIGLVIRPKQQHIFRYFPCQGLIDLEKLSIFATIKKQFSWLPTWAATVIPDEKSLNTLAETVNSLRTTFSRTQFISEINDAEFEFDTDILLPALAQYAENIFDEDIVIVKEGECV